MADRLGATAGLARSGERTVGQANRGTPCVSSLKSVYFGGNVSLGAGSARSLRTTTALLSIANEAYEPLLSP